MTDLVTKYEVINELIEDLTVQLKPSATGHIITAISVLKEEQQKIREEIRRKVA